MIHRAQLRDREGELQIPRCAIAIDQRSEKHLPAVLGQNIGECSVACCVCAVGEGPVIIDPLGTLGEEQLDHFGVIAARVGECAERGDGRVINCHHSNRLIRRPCPQHIAPAAIDILQRLWHRDGASDCAEQERPQENPEPGRFLLLFRGVAAERPDHPSDPTAAPRRSKNVRETSALGTGCATRLESSREVGP